MPGRFRRHQDHRLLLVLSASRGRSCPSRCRSCSADLPRPRPPLAAGDHVIVAFAQDRRLGCSSHPRMRPPARSSRMPSGSRRPAAASATFPCCVRAVAHDRFHVAGVRRRTVEYLWRPWTRPMIGQWRVFEVGQPGAVRRVRQKGSTAPRREPSASTPRSAWSASSVHHAECSLDQKRCSFG